MQLNILVNFGGPRHLNEIEPFLKALLCDQDVIRSHLPPVLHRLLFSRVAKKRAKTIKHDYQLIGGKSPIYEDTESIAESLKQTLPGKILTFHRYLSSTHASFFEEVESQNWDEIRVFPLFPQFSYATTGSIARFFFNHLCGRTIHKMRWVKSYAAHPAYVSAMQNCIKDFLKEKQLREEEVVLFFSPHGLPKKFICSGDVYQTECERSYRYISSAFPHALSIMAYQSKFGRGEWLRPYTNEVCEDVGSWGAGRKQVVFVPLSFTSDHVETLFEVEQQYLPVIRKKGFEAYRCPALNHRPDWLSAIPKILNEADFCNTQMLIAREMKRCCTSCNPTCCTCK